MILPIAYFSPWYMTRLARRGSPQWEAEQRMTFTDSGIEGSNGSATSFISWEAIVRVVDTPRFLLLFSSPQVAFGVPKRGLAGPAEASALLDYVQARAGHTGAAPPPAPSLLTGDQRLTAEFSWSTWQAFLAYWAICRRGINVWPSAAIAVGIGVISMGESVLVQHRNGSSTQVTIGLVALSLALLAIILLIYPVVALFYAIWLPRRTPSIGATQRLIVFDDGIRVRGRITAADVRWSMLTRVVETRLFFLFFLSKIQAFYLPKSAISPAEIEILRGVLRLRDETGPT